MPQESTSEEITIQPSRVEEFDLLDLDVFRANDGIHIKAKSAKLEGIFKPAGIATSAWGTQQLYRISSVFENSNFHAMIYYHGSDKKLFNDGASTRPNISWARIVGLTDGIEVVLHQVSTEEEMKEYCEAVKKTVLDIYTQFAKPFRRKLVIKCQLSQ